jgi:hypothetical protein
MKRQRHVPPTRALPPHPEARTVTLRLPDPPLVPAQFSVRQGKPLFNGTLLHRSH